MISSLRTVLGHHRFVRLVSPRPLGAVQNRRPARHRKVCDRPVAVKSVPLLQIGRIPHDLPQMAIVIGEVARISPVESLLGQLYDGRARFACLFHDFIHLASLRNVVADRERGAARGRFRQTAIVTQIGPSIVSEILESLKAGSWLETWASATALVRKHALQQLQSMIKLQSMMNGGSYG